MPLFCPACKSTYQDETLAFCLSDGTRLVRLENDSQATVQMARQTNPVRVSLQNSEPTIQLKSSASTAPKKKGAGLILALLAVVFLAVIAIAAAIGAYFMLGGKNDIVSATPTPTTTPARANTSANSNAVDKTNLSTKELEEKLNRLEKQLEEQKKINQTKSSDNQTQNQSGYATAKVNSPNDGFLALRSNPDTETGTQIMKIPHGATVILNNCEKNTVRVGGRNGRWCEVDYANKSGWVFSAWLDY